MQYEYGVWTPDEVESLKSEIYTITPEDEAELYRLNERFAGNTANSNLVETMGKSLGQNERLWPFMKSGVILPPWKDRRGGSGGGFAMSGYGLGPGFRASLRGLQQDSESGCECDDCGGEGTAEESSL